MKEGTQNQTIEITEGQIIVNIKSGQPEVATRDFVSNDYRIATDDERKGIHKDKDCEIVPPSLSKEEAIEAMKAGHMIHYEYWLGDGWVKLNPDGNVEYQDGYIVKLDDFIDATKHFLTGWSIVSPPSVESSKGEQSLKAPQYEVFVYDDTYRNVAIRMDSVMEAGQLSQIVGYDVNYTSEKRYLSLWSRESLDRERVIQLDYTLLPANIFISDFLIDTAAPPISGGADVIAIKYVGDEMFGFEGVAEGYVRDKLACDIEDYAREVAEKLIGEVGKRGAKYNHSTDKWKFGDDPIELSASELIDFLTFKNKKA